MAVGGNVEVKGFARFIAVENLYVSGTITTSGSMQLGQVLVDGDSDLILSSSATSMVVVSGNLNVLGALTVNGSPVGGSSEVTGATNFFTTTQLDSRGTITNTLGNLILSSSLGSQVRVSGALVVEAAFTASNGQLVIGPHGGNQNAIRNTGNGSLTFNRRSDNVFNAITFGTEAATNPGFRFSAGAAPKMEVMKGDFGNYADFWVSSLSTQNGDVVLTSSAGTTSKVIGFGRHLVLSSSVGNIVMSGNTNFLGAISNKSIRTITTTTSVAAHDHIVLCDSTGGAYSVFLPTPTLGRELSFKRIAGANTVTLTGSASELMDGVTTYLLDTDNESVTLEASGSGWYII